MSKKISRFDRFRTNKVGSIILVIAALIIYLYLGTVISLYLGAVNGSLTIDLVIAGFSYYFMYAKNSKYNYVYGHQFKNKKQKINSVLGLTILLIIMCFVAQVFGQVLGHILTDPNFKIYSKMQSQNTALTLAMALMVAPICEELFFRGFIYNLLKASYNYLIAGIIAALIFGLMHGTITQGFSVILLALFNTMIYELTGKIKYSIMCHIIYNLIALITAGLIIPKALVNVYVMGTSYLIILGVILFLFYYLNRHLKVNKNKPVSGLAKALMNQ